MDPLFFTPFAIFIIVAIGFLFLTLILFFFEPGLAYRIRKVPTVPSERREFARLLEMVADTYLHKGNRVDVLTNGEVFYEEELAAIRNARHHVHLEAYIFYRGRLTDRFIEALTERARASLEVRIVLDAIGCFFTFKRHFRRLLEAGGRVEFYHPLRWYLLPRFNNRTHREILIVDGTVAFVGGAGYADHWIYDRKRRPRWRDTMVRVEGEVVRRLQSTFVENWLESSGEILMGERIFPATDQARGDTLAMAVGSSPSAGRSTRARILFQTLIASAQKSIYITSPYFLPDQGARQVMIRAVRERGVDLKILTPGKKSDHVLIAAASRRLYGELLTAGATIAEYLPTMIHTKTMIVDDLWSVVGSTNFDYRSFGINDEVNLVACDETLAARIKEDFLSDLSDSRVVTYADWRRRPVLDRMVEWFGWIIERQQ